MTTAIATTEPTYSLGELVAYMLRLGTFGFGGPVALAGYMRRDLVERRHPDCTARRRNRTAAVAFQEVAGTGDRDRCRRHWTRGFPAAPSLTRVARKRT